MKNMKTIVIRCQKWQWLDISSAQLCRRSPGNYQDPSFVSIWIPLKNIKKNHELKRISTTFSSFPMSSFASAVASVARRLGQKAAQPAEAAAPSAANGRDPAEHRRGRREGASVTGSALGSLWPMGFPRVNMGELWP